MMTSGSNDMLDKVQNYRKIVQTYEELNQKINRLLEANRGSTEKMSQADRDKYRSLARQRDEVHNEMRWLEKQLLDEDTRH